MKIRKSVAMMVVAAAVTASHELQAGPPLLCQQIEIGDAASLPWGHGAFEVRDGYAIDRIVPDVLARLQPDVPVLVRMETLRRATIYLGRPNENRFRRAFGTRDEKRAGELLSALSKRARDAEAAGRPDALATFDAGYLAACYRQAELPADLDGHVWVDRAIELRREDAALQYAAMLISIHPAHPERTRHLAGALAGAPDGSLLARNIEATAKRWSWGTLAELRRANR